MFYDWATLFQQNHGRLGIAWTAATRGIKFLEKKDIREANIEKLCDDIFRYVCSNSTSPKQRFSLRLSSMLINGVIKIYREQTTIFLKFVVQQLSIVNVPPQLSIYEDDAASIVAQPQAVIIKARKPRASGPRKQKDTPLEALLANITASEILTLEEVNIPGRSDDDNVPAPSCLITLPEEQSLKITEIQDEANELGNLDDEELRQLLGDAPFLPIIQESPQAPPTQTLSRKQAPVIISSQTIVHQAQVHASAGSFDDEPTGSQQRGRINQVEELPAAERIDLIEQVAEPPPAVQRTDQIEDISAMPPPPPPLPLTAQEEGIRRRRVSKRSRSTSTSGEEVVSQPTQQVPAVFPHPKCRIKLKSKLIRRINRCEKHQTNSVKRTTIILPKLNALELDPSNLLVKYQMASQEEIDEIEEIRPEVRESTAVETGRDTIEMVRRELTSLESSTKRRKTSADIQISTDRSVIPMEITQIEHPIQEIQEIPQVLPIDVEGIQITSTPRQQKASMDIEDIQELIKLQEEIPPVDQITTTETIQAKEDATLGQTREETIAVAGKRVARKKLEIVFPPTIDQQELSQQEKRYQQIIDQVASAMTDLTIDDVCLGTLNRRNVAKTFSDVLDLSKAGYVSLVGDKYCELKFIRKGRKLK